MLHGSLAPSSTKPHKTHVGTLTPTQSESINILLMLVQEFTGNIRCSW